MIVSELPVYYFTARRGVDNMAFYKLHEVNTKFDLLYAKAMGIRMRGQYAIVYVSGGEFDTDVIKKLIRLALSEIGVVPETK